MNVSISVDVGAGEQAGAGGSLLPGMSAATPAAGMPEGAGHAVASVISRTTASGPATGFGRESFQASWLRILRDVEAGARAKSQRTGDGEGPANEIGAAQETVGAAGATGERVLASMPGGSTAGRMQSTAGLNGRMENASQSQGLLRVRDVASGSKTVKASSHLAAAIAANEPARAWTPRTATSGTHAGRTAKNGAGRGDGDGPRAATPGTSSGSVTSEMANVPPASAVVAAAVEPVVAHSQRVMAGWPDGTAPGEANQAVHSVLEWTGADGTSVPGRATERMSALVPASGRSEIAARNEWRAEATNEEQGVPSVESELGLDGQTAELSPGLAGSGGEIGRSSDLIEHRGDNSHEAAAVVKAQAGGNGALGARAVNDAGSAVPKSTAENAAAGAIRGSLSLNRDALSEKPKLTAHVSGAGDVSLPAPRVAPVQATGVGAEASAWVRDSGGMHGTAGATAGRGHDVGGGTGDPAGSQTREAFAAADSGAGMGAPSWIHAGPRRAEAGFEDPALGWVGVRADLSGGSVHASLVPGTAEAAQILGGHLKGLSEYLTEQHAPVTTLTMDDAGGGGVGSGTGQHLQQGAGQNAERSENAEAQRSAQVDSRVAAADRNARPDSVVEPLPYAGGSRGVHVSVMA